jgi:hypothetical protein
MALPGCLLGAAALAAVTPERVLFEDSHIRFVQVVNQPGVNHDAAVPYPSVVFADVASPVVHEVAAEPSAGKPASPGIISHPGDGNSLPVCHVQAPIGARTVTVDGGVAQTYFRIDYKRVDGTDFATHWQTWYKDVVALPAKQMPDLGKKYFNGKPYSKMWPYDFHYNAIDSAPANHTVRYHDDRLELIEVTVRQGETEHMHGHPFYSIFADDGGFWPKGADYANLDLSKSSFQAFGTFTSPRDEPTFPKCWSSMPQAPHEVTVKGGPPQHFYRVHLKKILPDGELARAARPAA